MAETVSIGLDDSSRESTIEAQEVDARNWEQEISKSTILTVKTRLGTGFERYSVKIRKLSGPEQSFETCLRRMK